MDFWAGALWSIQKGDPAGPQEIISPLALGLHRAQPFGPGRKIGRREWDSDFLFSEGR